MFKANICLAAFGLALVGLVYTFDGPDRYRPFPDYVPTSVVTTPSPTTVDWGSWVAPTDDPASAPAIVTLVSAEADSLLLTSPSGLTKPVTTVAATSLVGGATYRSALK